MARPTFVSRFRQSLARTLFLAAALAGSAQAATQTAPVPISEPLVTVTASLGNAMGWLGVQAERYFVHGRISASAGWGTRRA